MGPLDILSLLLGVVGTLIALWVALAGKQLLRPRFSVEVGVFSALFEDNRLRRFWQPKTAINTVAVGTTATDMRYLTLPLVLQLKNRGNLPVSDIDVVFEYPEAALIETSGLVGPVAGQIARVGLQSLEGRAVSRFQGLAQSRIPLGILRPGETMFAADPLQLRTGLIAPVEGAVDTHRSQTLRNRFASCDQLRSALEVRISVWSSSMRPVSLSVLVLWLTAKDKEELADGLARMARASADDGPIPPGLYFSPPWSRVSRNEVAEIAMISAGQVDEVTRVLSTDGILDSCEGAVMLTVPPWGLWGEAFEVTERWNVRLRSGEKESSE